MILLSHEDSRGIGNLRVLGDGEATLTKSVLLKAHTRTMLISSTTAGSRLLIVLEQPRVDPIWLIHLSSPRQPKHPAERA